jgi:hypothetical protein
MGLVSYKLLKYIDKFLDALAILPLVLLGFEAVKMRLPDLPDYAFLQLVTAQAGHREPDSV